MANVHTTEQRAFIVWSLANCVEPETIVIQFAKRWKGVPCTVTDVSACAPHRLTGDWKKYFDQERAVWQDAPLSKKENRIALLNTQAIKLASVGGADNMQHLIKIMELLAKEDAGFFVPKPVKGAEDDSKTVATDVNDVTPKMTAEQAAEAYASTLNGE